MRVQHSGSSGSIYNITGDLHLINDATDADIVLSSDDGSSGTTPYITLDGSAVLTKFDKPTQHNDAITAKFGSDGDYTIQHDGNHA